MADVFVGPTPGLLGAEGQQGLGAVQGLDSSFFIDAQDQGVFGRIQIQTHDVQQLGLEAGVGTESEGLEAMRLQPRGRQHFVHRGARQVQVLGQCPHAPATLKLRLLADVGLDSLPSFTVVLAGAAAPKLSEQYFLWSGESKTKSATGDWQRALAGVFKEAEIPDGHAYRFRDTFAVGLLQAGVPMDRVSALLGHSSIKVTEKHYSPWVRARQEQLEADVRRAWGTERWHNSEGVSPQ